NNTAGSPGISVGAAAANVTLSNNVAERLPAGLFGSVYWPAVSTGLAPAPNLLVNPGMAVDQVNEGTTAALSGAGTVNCLDEWNNQISATNGQTGTCQRTADAPPGAAYSLKVTVTASGTTPAGDYLRILQPLPADLVAGLGYGAATARDSFLSYWIKSSLTGTFGVRLANAAN